jgi:hypothetical protein
MTRGLGGGRGPVSSTDDLLSVRILLEAKQIG